MDTGDELLSRYRRPEVARRYDDVRFRGFVGRLTFLTENRAVGGLLARLPGGRFLDCPCGTGRFLPLFPRGGRGYVGGDFSEEMLPIARAILGPGRPLVRCDARRLPFRDGSFDGAICFRFLHLLASREERVAVLREMARCARGGVIADYRVAPSAKSLGRRIRRALTGAGRLKERLSRREVEAEFEEAGLCVEREAWVFPFFSEKRVYLGRKN